MGGPRRSSCLLGGLGFLILSTVCLCFLVSLSNAKECNNVPTERVSHTIRSRGIEKIGPLDSLPVVDGEFRTRNGFEGELERGRLALSASIERFLSFKDRGGGIQRKEVQHSVPVNKDSVKDLKDDVLLDIDDWDHAWNKVMKPLLDLSAQRAESAPMHTGSSQISDDIPAMQSLQANENDEKHSQRRGRLSTAVPREPNLSPENVFLTKWAPRGLLKDISLHKVRLGQETLQFEAQNTNLQYLLELDVDSMVWNFREIAKLDAPGQPYGGWESPFSELRGHFVGHYLSATALMWASTHNEALFAKMNLLIRALKECQMSLGTGYVSAFPEEFFDRFEAIEYVWAPYYTIHKIMAGLLDQHLLGGSRDALDMVVRLANYFNGRVKSVIKRFTIERHWRSLNEETGGMNDVLYRLYTVTRDDEHLKLAHLFDKPCFLGPLALEADHLSGFHSNTHIPIVVGAQMRYEVTGDPIYKSIAEYFMRVVNSSHSYVTGGTSVSEFWTDPMRQGDTLRTENQESCTTYNMLKISRTLFRWTKNIKYMDYYERALVNGVLGIQRGQQPGVMIYMLPLGPGVSKARSYHGWGNKFDSFWCCYGTAIESFAKLGDSVYFEEDGEIPSVYITQFVSSDFEWDAAGLYLHQSKSSLDPVQSILEVSFTISHGKTVNANGKGNAAIHIRIPTFISKEGCRAYLNGKEIEAPMPGTFLSIVRAWNPSDQVVILLPVSLRVEKIQDDRSKYSAMHAIMYGPFVMAGLSTGEWKVGHVKNLSSPLEWVNPVPAVYNRQLSTFTQDHVMGVRQFSEPMCMMLNNGSAVMGPVPPDGTDQSGLSTFRVAAPLANLSLRVGDQKRAVSLEVFSEPGRYLKHNGQDKLVSAGPPGCLEHTQARERSWVQDSAMYFERADSLADCPVEDSVFFYLPGLTGNTDTVSLEAASKPGCFLSSKSDESSVPGGIFLRCKTLVEDKTFNATSTFSVQKGLASYFHLSFVAKGESRNFLLAPIHFWRDESYTVYFEMH